MSVDKASLHLIDNSYHRHKADLLDPSFIPPKGWKNIWNEEQNANAVRHEQLPNHWFKFPFPIFPPLIEDTAYHSFPYLLFETRSCTLFLGASYHGYDGDELLTITLRDGQDMWAGDIKSPFVIEEEYSRGMSCELIAISKGRVNRDRGVSPFQPFPEMDKIQDIKNLEEYNFLNVLWIEWVGDVAYRKAMGRVWQEAWDRQDVKTTKVILA